jgi:hypothetical protein
MLRLLASTAIRDGARFSEGVRAGGALRGLRAPEFWADDTTLLRPLIDTSVIIGHHQVPDFHLLNFAVARGAKLVTLDAKITASCATPDRAHITSLLRDGA